MYGPCRADPWANNTDNEVTITFGNEEYDGDGVHSDGSKHYDGDAVDLRMCDLDDDEIDANDEELKEELGDDYDVIYKGTHTHVEYDPDCEV